MVLLELQQKAQLVGPIPHICILASLPSLTSVGHFFVQELLKTAQNSPCVLPCCDMSHWVMTLTADCCMTPSILCDSGAVVAGSFWGSSMTGAMYPANVCLCQHPLGKELPAACMDAWGCLCERVLKLSLWVLGELARKPRAVLSFWVSLSHPCCSESEPEETDKNQRIKRPWAAPAYSLSAQQHVAKSVQRNQAGREQQRLGLRYFWVLLEDHGSPVAAVWLERPHDGFALALLPRVRHVRLAGARPPSLQGFSWGHIWLWWGRAWVCLLPGSPCTSCPSLAGTGDPESLRWAAPSGVAMHSWVLTSPFFLLTALRYDHM